MTRIYGLLFLVIAASLTFGCGAKSHSPGNQNSANAAGSIMPGGYADASTSDTSVVNAANFAAKEQSKGAKAITVKSIEQAQQQVVAGMNFWVDVVVDEAGTERKAEAVVYQDLQQNYALTSWTWN